MIENQPTYNIVNIKYYFIRTFFSGLFFTLSFILLPFVISRLGDWGIIGKLDLPKWYYIIVIFLIILFFILGLIFLGVKYYKGKITQKQDIFIFDLIDSDRFKIDISNSNDFKIINDKKLPFYIRLFYGNRLLLLKIKHNKYTILCSSGAQKAYLCNFILNPDR